MATAHMYLCGLCGMAFAKHQQLGPHARVCRRRNTIIRHAEFVDTNESTLIYYYPVGIPPAHSRVSPQPTRLVAILAGGAPLLTKGEPCIS